MGGAASSWMLDVLGKKMMERDFKPAFAIKHQQKDLAIVLKSARQKGVPLPGTALVQTSNSTASASSTTGNNVVSGAPIGSPNKATSSRRVSWRARSFDTAAMIRTIASTNRAAEARAALMTSPARSLRSEARGAKVLRSGAHPRAQISNRP